MSKTASLIVATFLLTCASCSTSHRIETKTVDDNTLLALVLSRYGSDKWVLPPSEARNLDPNDPNAMRNFILGLKDDPLYTVVEPQTTLGLLHTNDPKKVEQYKKHIREDLKIEGYDSNELIDLLFERNKESVRLSLESSRINGYVIDYEGEHDRYFKRGIEGWEKWYKDHPRATGFTSVSLPAYDPKMQIVLVYKAEVSGPLYGGGCIIAYKYESGKLRQIGYAGLWIS